MDHVVARHAEALCRGEGGDLAMDGRDRGGRLLQGEGFHQLGEGERQRPAYAFVRTWLGTQRPESARAIPLDWSWPHDSGHMWEAVSPHPSCLKRSLALGSSQALACLTFSLPCS